MYIVTTYQRVTAILLACVIMFGAHPASAQAPFIDCDKVAANPTDARKHPSAEGVQFKQVRENVAAVLSACSKAMETYPNELRFRYQFARGLQVKDKKAAFNLFLQLTNANYPAAYDNVGWLFISENKDFDKAITYFKAGYERGDADCATSLFTMISDGKLDPPNADQLRITLLEKAAAANHAGALVALPLEREKLAQKLTAQTPTRSIEPNANPSSNRFFQMSGAELCAAKNVFDENWREQANKRGLSISVCESMRQHGTPLAATAETVVSRSPEKSNPSNETAPAVAASQLPGGSDADLVAVVEKLKAPWRQQIEWQKEWPQREAKRKAEYQQNLELWKQRESTRVAEYQQQLEFWRQRESKRVAEDVRKEQAQTFLQRNFGKPPVKSTPEPEPVFKPNAEPEPVFKPEAEPVYPLEPELSNESIASALQDACSQSRNGCRAETFRKTSEVSPMEYERNCGDVLGRMYERDCAGKWVVWSGVIYGVDDSSRIEVKVKTGVQTRNFDLFLRSPMSLSGNKSAYNSLPVTFAGRLWQPKGSAHDLKDVVFLEFPDADSIAALDAKKKADEEMAVRERSAKRQAEAEQQAQEDRRLAAQWGVTMEQMEAGKREVSRAAVRCQMLVEQSARYGYEEISIWSGGMAHDSWKMKGPSTLIVTAGNRLKLKNGFGASRRVTYSCYYNIDSKEATVLDVSAN